MGVVLNHCFVRQVPVNKYTSVALGPSRVFVSLPSGPRVYGRKEMVPPIRGARARY